MRLCICYGNLTCANADLLLGTASTVMYMSSFTGLAHWLLRGVCEWKLRTHTLRMWPKSPISKMYHTQLLEDTNDCFVRTSRAHFLPMMIWKVDPVRQYRRMDIIWAFTCMIYTSCGIKILYQVACNLVLQYLSCPIRQKVYHTAPLWGSFAWRNPNSSTWYKSRSANL